MSRIDETIKTMEGFIKELEDETLKYTAKLSDEGKKQANELANKTISTINSSIEKLNGMKETVTDESSMEDFLNRLEDKCKDVTDFTKIKIKEIKPILRNDLEDIKSDIEKGIDDFKKDLQDVKANPDSSLNKLLENENVKNAIKLAKAAKEKAIEFYNDPKTQKAINEAKLKAIDLAERGLDNLKVLLERTDDKNED